MSEEAEHRIQRMLEGKIPSAYGAPSAPKQKRPLSAIVAGMLEAIDEAGGEITAAVDALELELEDKAQAYRAVILQLEGEQKMLKELIDAYDARMETRENHITGLKFRLEQAMRAVGVEKIKTPTCTAYFQGSKRVELENEAVFLETAEDRFVVVKSSPNKQELKKALEAGEAVAGASLVETKHLRFR